MLVNYVTDNRVEEGTNLWDLLGVPEISDTQVIDKAWSRCEQRDDQRYAWKALRDPLYRDLYRRCNSIEILEKAGFFDDGLPCGVEQLTASDPRFLCTPVKKMDVSADMDIDQYVLITTGAFSPVHLGHIAMMHEAKKLIESEGGRVAGMYFCPGHDSYVGNKYNGTAAIPVEERIHMLDLATDADEYLAVDPWAARYLPCEVNFTDVLYRMKRYLQVHVSHTIKVAYVYGSDNEGFGLVLEGSEFRALPITRTPASSTQVRNGRADLLPDPVRNYLNSAWPTGVYQIRDDKLGQEGLRQSIIALLSDTMAPNPIEILDADDQRSRGREVVGPRKSISLDPLYEADYQFQMSRIFHPADFQSRGVIGHRPSSFALDIQAKRIPAGDYVLVEDDIASGATVAMAKQHLSAAGVNIIDEVILANLDTKPVQIMDVVDARDFMLNTPHAGLVVERYGYPCRAPYNLPYVNLRTRAKVHPRKELDLALELWKLNRQYSNPDIALLKCENMFARFTNLSGWDMETTLVDYCDFHIRVLEEAKGKPCTPA